MTDMTTAEEILKHYGLNPDFEWSTSAIKDIEDILEQHGVKGMRWGHRKDRGSRVSPAAQRAHQKAEIKNLTNEELQARIKRLQLEQQFAQLTTPKKTQHPAAKFLTDVLVNAGKQQATAYASQFMGMGAEAVLKKAGVKTAKTIAAGAAKNVAKDVAKAVL